MVPIRIDETTQIWFYEQHRLLWRWVAGLSRADIAAILAQNPGHSPDYAIKQAWPGWGDRWGLAYGSFACEVGGESRTRCFKCPLGTDYCQLPASGYQKFLAAIRKGDIAEFKQSALEIRDAWRKPRHKLDENRWW